MLWLLCCASLLSLLHPPSMLPFNSFLYYSPHSTCPKQLLLPVLLSLLPDIFPPIPILTSTSLLTRQLFQVRNAINALQELATTTNTVASNRFPFPLPAHSNPNIPRVRGNEGDAPLPRSSSHPPEMFCWEDNAERERLVSAETQTDIPLDYIQQFVLENRQLVLSWLDAKVCVFRETEQKNKSADWLMDPLPPPTLWNTQHHRFSAGDVTERTSQILYQHLPSSKSLKFHPYSWMLWGWWARSCNFYRSISSTLL